MPPCEMSPSFDSVTWDRLGEVYGQHANHPAWGGLVNAHNGIAYRFWAAVAADKRFAGSFSLAGPRCEEEEALFSFFYNAVGSIECALYGLHHLGAISIGLGFPISKDGDLRAINRRTVRERFERAFPGEPLTIAIGKVLDDRTFARLLEFRDVLTHRGSVPRNHRVTMREPNIARIPEDVDAVFLPAKPKSSSDETLMELDTKTTSTLLVWLAQAQRSILGETLRFAEQRLTTKAKS
jgi:hypothetical protein